MEQLELDKQNEVDVIQYLAAAEFWHFQCIKNWFWTRFVIVSIPVGLGCAALLFPSLSVWAGWFGIVSTLLVVMLFEEQDSELRRKANGALEFFERKVLSIPWNRILLGSKPDSIEITKGYMAYKLFDPDCSAIKNFFPVSKNASGSAEALRLRYQLAAVRVEFKLRTGYCFRLKLVLLFLLIGFAGLALAFNSKSVWFMSKIVIPLSPVVVCLLQEYAQHKRSAQQYKILTEQIELAIEILEAASNDWPMHFQDQIYRLRSSSPNMLSRSVFEFVSTLPKARIVDENLLQSSAAGMKIEQG